MSYPIKLKLTYEEFMATVQDMDSCSAFIDGRYKAVTDEMLEKIKSGKLVITEYHDMPLGEVIYLEAAPELQ